MKKIIENFANMIKVKSFITFLVVGAFVYLSIVGVIDPKSVENICLMVVSFYFGTQHEKKGGE
jgi:hypothetical protein